VRPVAERDAQLVRGELPDKQVPLSAAVQPSGDQPQLARPAELEVEPPIRAYAASPTTLI